MRNAIAGVIFLFIIATRLCATVDSSKTGDVVTETAIMGDEVMLVAESDGYPAPTYQWRKNGVAIVGEIDATLDLTSVTAVDAGTYTVIATNKMGSAISNDVELVVNEPLLFVTQPVSQMAMPGDTVTFTVVAAGTPAPTLQWLLDGVALPGKKGNTLTLHNVKTSDSGTYSVVATNIMGAVGSDDAILIINTGSSATTLPIITAHPASQAVHTGATVTLAGAAIGLPAPVYEWVKNSKLVPGATSSSLTFNNVSADDAGYYILVATNSVGTTISHPAMLTIDNSGSGIMAPIITAQPVGQTVVAGTTVTFSVAASGNPNPTFQWQRNGLPLPGATGPNLTLPNVSPSDNGTYSAFASNSAGAVYSYGAALIVTAVSGPPVVTTQPISQSVNVGANVTFTAAATGIPAPTYQWIKNSVLVPGATGATLTLTNVSSADAGSYIFIATNSVGTAISNTATLTVGTSNVAPAITTQPVNQTVVAGSTVSFTVAASGSPAPTYQWQRNGVPLPGATGPNLTLPNVSPSDGGTYSALATNVAGSAVSYGALLTVTATSSFPVVTTQPVSQSVNAGATVTFTAAATGIPAPTYQWIKNSVLVPGATGATLTLTNVSSADAGSYIFIASNSVGTAVSNTVTLTVGVGNVAPAITTQPASQTVIAGSTVSFTVAASGSPAPTFQWQRNGVALPGSTGPSLTLVNVGAADEGTYAAVATNAAGSVSSNGAVLTVTTTSSFPVVTTQPISQSVNAGVTVTFTAAATGIPAPTYKWIKNSVLIPGATGATLTLTNVSAADAGYYIFIASNSVGTVISNIVTLTVGAGNVAPAITTQPVSQTVFAGGAVSFTVAASGSPTPTYQWQRNGVALPGSTGPSLTLPNVSLSDSGTYSAVATNVAGSVTSNGAILTVTPAWSMPVVTTQPISQSVTAGATVTFTAAATGVPAPTYEWVKNSVLVPGATGPTLTLTNVTSADAGYYIFVASNSVGTSISTTALLTVNASTVAPAITTQPVSQTVIAGSTVTFTAAASGSPTPTFQWQRNGVAVPGWTGPSLKLANVSANDIGTYRVVATNLAGSVVSNGAVLAVTPLLSAPVVTTQPISQSASAGATVTFTAAAVGSPSPTYEWVKNSVLIPGATGPSLTLTNVSSADAGYYIFIASNSVGASISNSAILTVNATNVAPVITTQPVSQTVTTGATVTFTVAASGSPAPTFQWLRNGVAVPSWTGPSLTLVNVTAADMGTYSAVATNLGGSITSNGAVLTVNAIVSPPTLPVITLQPVSQTVTPGSSVTFAAGAVGNPAPTFKWVKNSVLVPGATGSSLTLNNVKPADAGYYIFIATNNAGTTISNIVFLALDASSNEVEGSGANIAPVFTLQPISQAVIAGRTVILTAGATGTPSPTFQWLKDGIAIPGGQDGTLVLPGFGLDDIGTYAVIATNEAGSAASNNAVLVLIGHY